ncbi:MAG: hypothetical protein HZA28_03650 [Candidatus Omnitrophica bacterium]|nr:hypothetical protein [Candidatus Omnitrophota bacterium]
MKNFNAGNRHACSLQEFDTKYPKPLTVRQIQKLDKVAIERCGIPSLVLMENAGRAVAEEVQKSLRGKKKPRVS